MTFPINQVLKKPARYLTFPKNKVLKEPAGYLTFLIYLKYYQDLPDIFKNAPCSSQIREHSTILENNEKRAKQLKV